MRGIDDHKAVDCAEFFGASGNVQYRTELGGVGAGNFTTETLETKGEKATLELV